MIDLFLKAKQSLFKSQTLLPSFPPNPLTSSNICTVSAPNITLSPPLLGIIRSTAEQIRRLVM